RVETPAEGAALAALVTLPQLGRGVVIDHPRDIDRKRVDRVDGVALRALVTRRRRGLARRAALRVFLARSAGEEIGQPAAAIVVAGVAVVLAALNRAQVRRA